MDENLNPPEFQGEPEPFFLESLKFMDKNFNPPEFQGEPERVVGYKKQMGTILLE